MSRRGGLRSTGEADPFSDESWAVLASGKTPHTWMVDRLATDIG